MVGVEPEEQVGGLLLCLGGLAEAWVNGLWIQHGGAHDGLVFGLEALYVSLELEDVAPLLQLGEQLVCELHFLVCGSEEEAIYAGACLFTFFSFYSLGLQYI